MVLMIIGFILRLSIAATHSYSSDELSAINRLDYDSLAEMLENGVKKGDFHPAGVQLFEWFWSSIFGTSEVALRFPFVLFGVASIFMIYVIGKKFVAKNTGIFAATLLTVSYFPIIHSELARPYSPGLFFVLIASWFYLHFFTDQIQNRKSAWRYAIGLGISLALAMYTHYFAFLFVGFIGITGLFFIKKKYVLPYVTAGLLASILFLPHWPITTYHLGIDGGLGWLGKPEKGWLFDFLFFAFNRSWVFIGCIVLTVLITLFLTRKYKIHFNKVVFLFVLWFFGIFVVAYIFSYVSSPILKYPVMLFPLPFFYLLIGSFFSSLSQKTFRILLIMVGATGIYSTVVERDLYGNNHFGLLKEIAKPMVKWRAKYGADNIVTYMNINNPNYLNYYAIPLGDSLTFDRDVLEFDDDKKIRKELLNEKRDYCVFGYSTRTTLPQLFETCLEFYPTIVESHRYNNSAVVLLSDKKNEDKTLPSSNVVATFEAENPSKKWKTNNNHRKNNYYLSDSTAAFGPSFSFRMVDYGLKINDDRHDHYLKITVNGEASLGAKISATFTAKRKGKAITNLDGKKIWLGHDLEKMMTTPTKNNQAYFAFFLPTEILESDELNINLWNRNGKPVKINRIKIEWVLSVF